MRRILILVCLFVLLVTPATAQSDETEAWSIIERCIGEPVEPPDDWTFAGIIFLNSNMGIHGLNSIVETAYFLAYNSDESFGRSGAISPDGRWFAFPAGHRSYGNSITDWFGVDTIRVVSTYGDNETYQIDWRWAEMGSSSWIVPRLEWIGDDELIYEESDSNDVYVINPFTSERQLLEAEHEFNQAPIGFNSPSNKYWQHDKTFYVTSANETIRLYDANEQLFSKVLDGTAYLFNWNFEDTLFAFLTYEHELLIGDMIHQEITNTCLNVEGIAWSPDGELAVSDGERISIINFENGTHYIAAYHEGSVFDWRVPPEEE